MLPRPTRSVAIADLVTPFKVVGLDQPDPNKVISPIGREDLPDFLFEDDSTPIEEAPAAVEERWSEPFVGGVALSDKVMSYGRKTDAPPDHLPYGAAKKLMRGRNSRSA